MDLSLRSIKTNNWPADKRFGQLVELALYKLCYYYNFKGQVTSTSCTLEPVSQVRLVSGYLFTAGRLP